MSQIYVSRAHIRRSLMRAATARTWITIVAAVAMLVLTWIAFSSAMEYLWVAVLALVVVPPLAAWVATQLLCRHAAECPACRGSLWDAASAGFLPNQIKLKEDVQKCPHCGAVLL